LEEIKGKEDKVDKEERKEGMKETKKAEMKEIKKVEIKVVMMMIICLIENKEIMIIDAI
jgi:hypothetical protein